MPTITDGEREYKVTCDDDWIVTVSCNDGPDDLNAISFAFPLPSSLNCPARVFGRRFPFGEDGVMTCLHVYIHKQKTNQACSLHGRR